MVFFPHLLLHHHHDHQSFYKNLHKKSRYHIIINQFEHKLFYPQCQQQPPSQVTHHPNAKKKKEGIIFLTSCDVCHFDVCVIDLT